MADRIIKGDSGNDVIIQNNGGTRKIEVTNSGDVEVTGDVKTTTVKATNLKANDGTASLEVADSTGDIGFSGNTDLKIKLPSAGGIYESDGSTEILKESGGSVTLKNTTLDTTVAIGGSVPITRPAFLVQASAQSDVGDPTSGAGVTLDYDTVIKNLGGGTFSSNQYTAPVSGLYQINATAYFSGFPNNITSASLLIVCSNRTIQTTWSKTLNENHSTNYTIGFRISSVIDLDATDTVKIQYAQSGGSAAADLQSANSYFSGFLVCNY